MKLLNLFLLSLSFVPLVLASVVVPSDPNFNSQWYLNRSGSLGSDIDAPEAWFHTTGSGAVVAVLSESGVADHLDIPKWQPVGLLGGKHGGLLLDDLASPRLTLIAGVVAAKANNPLLVYSATNNILSSIPLGLDAYGITDSGVFSSFFVTSGEDVYYRDASNVISLHASVPNTDLKGIARDSSGFLWLVDSNQGVVGKLYDEYETISTRKIRVNIFEKHLVFFNFQAYLYELEVYNLQEDPDFNIAPFYDAVNANGYFYNFYPESVADGLMNTWWIEQTPENTPAWVELEFDEPVSINKVVLKALRDTFPIEYNVEYEDASGQMVELFSGYCISGEGSCEIDGNGHYVHSFSLPLISSSFQPQVFVGSQPTGLFIVDNDAWVLVNGENALKRVSLDSLSVDKTISLPVNDYRGVFKGTLDNIMVVTTASGELMLVDIELDEVVFSKQLSIAFRDITRIGSTVFTIDDADNHPLRRFSHSDHVAEKGTVGVCWDCEIMDVRLPLGASPADELAALNSALVNGADVVLFAYERYDPYPPLQNLINQHKDDVVFVAPTGDRSSTWKLAYPAAYQNVLAVAHSTKSGRAHFNSNKGTSTRKVADVFAPGQEIYGPLPGNNYGYHTSSYTATSWYAAGVTAGIAALLVGTLPVDSIYDAIIIGSVPMTHLSEGDVVNAYRSLTGFDQKTVKLRGVTFPNGDLFATRNRNQVITIALQAYNNVAPLNAVLSCDGVTVTSPPQPVQFNTLGKAYPQFTINTHSSSNSATCLLSLSGDVTVELDFKLLLTDPLISFSPVHPHQDYLYKDLLVYDVTGDGLVDTVVVAQNTNSGLDDRVEVVSGGSVVYALDIGKRLTYHDVSVVAGDINGDGIIEIVVAHRNLTTDKTHVTAFSVAQGVLWSYELEDYLTLSNSPVIADIDGDSSSREIVLIFSSSQYGYTTTALRVLRGLDGVVLPAFENFVDIGGDGYNYYTRTPLAVFDLTGNGRDEIVFIRRMTYNQVSLYAYDLNANLSPGFPVWLNEQYINEQYNSDLVLGTSQGVILYQSMYSLSAIDSSGTVLWDANLDCLYYESPQYSILADFSGGGAREVASSCSYYYWVEDPEGYGYEESGSNISLRDMSGQFIHSCWEDFTLPNTFINSGLRAADLTGDGRQELLFITNNEVHAYRYDCSALDGFPLKGPGGMSINDLYLSDLNFDNKLDMAFLTSTDNDGRLFAFRTPYNLNSHWPTSVGNERATMSSIPVQTVPRCSDNSALNHCSFNKPLKCVEGQVLVHTCSECGCESGYVCRSDGRCVQRINPKYDLLRP